MFRCKECQTEYEIKPDYCDCGNDTFDEILPEPVRTEVLKPERKTEKSALKPKARTKSIDSTKIDAYAYIIFALCILMSFVVIFFVGNPSVDEQTESEQEIYVQKNIPSIDRFWDNTPVKVPVSEEIEVPKNIIENIIPKVVQPKPVQPVTQKPKQIQTTQQKPQAVQNPVQKSVQPQQTQTTQKQNVQLPKSITDITVKQTQQTAKPVQTQTVANQQTTPVAKKLDQTEYAKYKNNLMSKIASKINFAGVIGNGSCTVSFSISSNGALINRKFDKQSENSTLNDAVYHAIMQTPSFNPPPEGYKGETIRINIKMFNGTFEVVIN